MCIYIVQRVERVEKSRQIPALACANSGQRERERKGQRERERKRDSAPSLFLSLLFLSLSLILGHSQSRLWPHTCVACTRNIQHTHTKKLA
jgi:hypothetical protein